MTYQEQVEQAKVDGKLESLEAAYMNFEKEGTTLYGKFLSVEVVHSSQGSGDYNLYLFDTDIGKVKSPLGAGVLQGGMCPFRENSVYRITYKGLKKLPNGRQMKDFDVWVVGGNNSVQKQAQQPAYESF